uniref:Cytochrome c oxidase subunit 5A, mitochondrial n=1 Tax=Aotus nancymaae TaxID=37293 RepID=A0A2K5ES33_AOTNA
MYTESGRNSPEWREGWADQVEVIKKISTHQFQSSPQATAVQSVRCYSHGSHETHEEFDTYWVIYFNRPDIDAWELHKGVKTLVGYDLLNGFASAVHILEVVKDKAGPHKKIYPYFIQELRPTLNELGISTPDELSLDSV